ncbi:Glutathione S-transferase kappa 1 [Chelonia mydas]|uniref:Glutathione S-transferase kappa 1 n=1 Tax=Chelonia mydas TaxID=8469 RepID=M7BXG8_CHEMY|nr:Glutathione S-transferase kappa 1 [Chelonia mydas]
MSTEGSSGASTADQPEAQIQLPIEETVSPKPKGISRCLLVKVFPFIDVTKDGYWYTFCKKACEEGKLPNAITGKSGGAWFVKPISKANADKLREKAAKHQASGVHQRAESSLSFCRNSTDWLEACGAKDLTVEKVLCRYRHNWSIELRFRPAFLGGIMKETGNQPPAMVPKRGEYMKKDIERMAKYYQVPLQLPKDFFGSVIRKGSLSAMRFITAVDMTQPQFLEPVSRELWMRIWSRDEDITQPESILAAAGEAGLPSALAQKLLAMTSTPEVKNRLKATTEEALNYGAFGMPALVAHVNGESHLFFGSDRLELLGNVIGECF